MGALPGAFSPGFSAWSSRGPGAKRTIVASFVHFAQCAVFAGIVM